MKIEDITDFLPKYPNINNYSTEILNPYDENLNLSIFKKKEFYDNKLDAYEDLPEKGQLLKHQKNIANFFSSRTLYDNLLLLHEQGTGKCMKIDTPIILYNGEIKMVQDINVGELLMGDDSTPRIVSSLARGIDEMYEIIPEKGDSYTVNKEHILCLKMSNYPEIICNDNLYIISWLKNNKFMSTIFTFEKDAKEFKEKIVCEQILEIEVRDFLKLPKEIQERLQSYKVSVDFPEQKLTMDAYKFGYLLRKEKNYIPDIYKYNSKENRLKLLGGLIDSYGNIENNCFVFLESIEKERMVKDIIYLSRSLGFYCYKKEKGKLWYIYIRGKGLEDIPTKIFKIQKQLKDELVSKITVKYVGRDNYYGFTLNGNCRYLIGDFTVTHNTCAAVGAIEQIKKENSSLNGAIILVRGKGLIDNFKDELVKKCTNGTYIPKEFKYLTEVQKIARINKLVGEYYTFYKFFEMGKKITYMTDEQIIQEFSNKIIVIDEVHNIRLKEIIKYKKKGDSIIPKETIYVYKEINRMLHLVKNSKILLMSGTPIKDKISEFANVLNLIIPKNKQLPTKQKFINEYFDFDENLPVLERIYTVKKNKIKHLKNLMKGKVSYLKAISSTIKKEFVGDKKVGGLKHFIVYKTFMNSNKIKFGDRLTSQSEIYKETFEEDKILQNNEDKKDEDNIYLDSRQSSLFVFPDGTYGNQGFKTWINKNKHIKTTGRKNKKGDYNIYYTYSLNTELKNLIYVPGDDENFTKTLINLKKYSTKYASVIKNLLQSVKEKKLSFVYCSSVEGSGAILFSFILQLFGFTKASPGINTKGLRYAFFTSDTSDSDIKKIKERFNSPDNLYGDYISVIIGSKLISEGYSFSNIQEEHILTPHWNYGEISQAIARGYRFGSHKDLINDRIKLLAIENDIDPQKYLKKKEIDFKLLSEAINIKLNKPINEPLDIVNPVLKVYQYVSIPTRKTVDKKTETQSTLSIDILMYKRSEIKDVNIKHIERIIKEMSFDCALNYDRNFREGYNNQVECDYMNCNYKCNGIPSKFYKKIEEEDKEESEDSESEKEDVKTESEKEDEEESEDEEETESEKEDEETESGEETEIMEEGKEETKDEYEEEKVVPSFNQYDYVKFIGYNPRLLQAVKTNTLVGQIIDKEPDRVGRYITRLKIPEKSILGFDPNDIIKITKEEYDSIEQTDSGDNEEFSIDYSTYQLYYNSNTIKDITDIINKIFKKIFQIELSVLLNKLNTYTEFDVITTLGDIINNNKIIYDKYNFPRYLRENNNIYFLVDNITVEGSFLLKYYTENSILNVNDSFKNVLENTFTTIIPKIIINIFETDEPDKIKKILSKLPPNVIELIIENSILSKLKNIQRNKIQRDIILNLYKSYYKEYEREGDNIFWICSYLYYDTNTLRCLKDLDEGWINCKKDDIDFFNKQKTEIENIIKKSATNPYGYYGKFNGDNFCITEVDEEALKEYERTGDARLLKTGGKCNQGKYQKGKLWDLVMNIFKLPLPSETRKDIPNNLAYWKELKKNKNNKIKYIKESKYFDEILSTQDVDNMEENEINRLYYWIRQSGDVKCKMLREFLETKNLLFEDPNCFIQTKIKTVKEKDIEKEEKKKLKEEKKKMKIKK